MAHSSPLGVVIAGGGTGGHLYPGVAVARALVRQRPDALVTFAGTAGGIEATVVPREGFTIDFIRSAGLKGQSAAALGRGLALLPVSGLDAWRLVSRRAPDVVIGVGGYASGPVVLVAALRGVPTMLLEQNALPGLTNRLLARVVRAAAVTYEASLPYFRGKGFVTGNPVRPEFIAGADRREKEATDDVARVLIVGGSQGSHAINVAMVEAAPQLAAGCPRLSVTHQAGERDVELVREGYRRAGVAAEVEPFLFTMDREMSRADVVVCRAGATTLAELAAIGKPAILIPLPTATDDHQRKNAAVLAAAGAAECLDERGLTGAALAARLIALLGDPARRTAMSAAARRLARPDAARAIADRALALAGR
jgi:UDP-N-acetylglucosamine--N-acetylmuramyl-(pentapeptide) pyrophosphoryl-undecaprenol N-acetylglucosamine transferase